MQRVRDADGRYRYTYVSPGMRETFGLDPEGIVGQWKVTHDWVHPDDRSHFVGALERSASTLQTFDDEVRIISDDGRLKWVRSIGYPRKLSDGAVVWDGIAVDVTERREASEMVQRALRIAKDTETVQARLVGGLQGDLRGPLIEIKGLVDALVGRNHAADVAAEIATLQQAVLSLMLLIEAKVNIAMPASGSSSDGPIMAEEISVDAKLGPRQREVLALLQEGLTNRDIANRLGIEVGTVKLHVAGVLKRLQVKNRTTAVLSTISRAREFEPSSDERRQP